ncbi:hypothetical protein PBY51_005414 [Eleginops maclovinus]|uniref:Uncharacterized protein n=1 Tax=Eleginops maclovinus TaxID=56733 RepID=A0AAN7X322_ELEMC|nr:hypothetical protein PBY51_005414 [Eleginops maclovinus]
MGIVSQPNTATQSILSAPDKSPEKDAVGNRQKIRLMFTSCQVAIDTPCPPSIELYSLAWRALLMVTGSLSIPHAGESRWLIQQPINDEIRRR